MDINIKEIGEFKREMELTLSYEDLIPHFNEAYEKYRKKAEIKGFRKGKAPLEYVKRLYGESIEYSATEDIANDEFGKYVDENKINVLGNPKLVDLDYKPKEKLYFKIEFEIMPEIVVENYKGIELTKKIPKIDDSALDEEINSINYRNSTKEIDGQAVDDDYIVTVDVQNLDDTGNVLIGEKMSDLRIYLKNPSMGKSFLDALKNIKENEERIADVEFGGEKPVKMKIHCKKVEKVIYPEMNEEYFKKITKDENVKTIEQFRENIKQDLLNYYNTYFVEELRNDAIDELIKLNDVSVPDIYVSTVLDGMVRDYKQELSHRKEKIDFDEEEFRKEKRTKAILSAKWYEIKNKIIKLENITLTEEDYKKFAETRTKKTNIPVDKLIQYFKSNERIQESILSDKLLDFIIDNAKITETEEVIKSENKEDKEDSKIIV